MLHLLQMFHLKLKCSLLSCKFKTLGSSHSYCISDSSVDITVTSSSHSSSLYTSTVQSALPPPLLLMQQARWHDFTYYFDSHCLSAEEYSSLSFSFAAALFTSRTLNAAKFSIPFGRIKRQPQAWWSAEVEEAVSERRKVFAATHRSGVDRQAYISASRSASSVIAKAKPEAWQATWSSLSPKSNPKSVYSLLHSIAGSSSSFPNFSNCFSLRESASVFADFLRSHFSVS